MADEVQVTLERAFDYLREFGGPEESEEFNVERVLRAIAYLLQWSTDCGNQALDGSVACGLALLTQQAASRIADGRERRRHERER